MADYDLFQIEITRNYTNTEWREDIKKVGVCGSSFNANIAVPNDHFSSTANNTWVKVFRIIPEFRILRLTFHRKSASKC